jgi:hypothetical protein
MYAEVRTVWFEYLSKIRQAKKARERNKESGKSKAVPRALSADLLKRFNDVAEKFNIDRISTGRELIEYLKLYPPSKISSSTTDTSVSQLQRRDAGFEFEASLAKELRLNPENVWVGRSAGSYGAADIIIFTRHRVTLVQCKKADAMRKSLSEHKKLKALYDAVHKIASVKMYYTKDNQRRLVTITPETLKVLSGEVKSWEYVTASVEEITRTPAEFKAMIEKLKVRVKWHGTTTSLAKAYEAVKPVIRKLAECGMQWSAELRLDYRKALDPFRGSLMMQDAHFTKALMTPAYAPFVFKKDDAHAERDSSLEGRIFKTAGLAIRVEKEPGVKSLVHVVRLTTNKSKFVAYACRKNGLLSAEEIDAYTDFATKLPPVVELRLAWYENKRLVKTKVLKSRKDVEYFSKQRGID